MGKIKFGRAFGLSILSALSLMAVFAVSAQAGEAGEFWVGSEGSFLLAKAKGAQEGTGTLLVAGRNLNLNCTTGAIKKGVLESKTLAEGEVEFSGCTALNHSTGAELPCTVGKVEGAPEPIIATGKILPQLHEKTKKYVTAEPLVEGGNFTTVVLSGKLCPIGGTYPIKGFVSAEATVNGAVVNLITANKAFSELVKDSLSFGAFPAFVIAKATAELIETHAGVKFGVV